jgi:hypothetical protein
MRNIIIAAIVALSATVAVAQEAPVTPVVATAAPANDVAANMFREVCNSKAVKSTKLSTACTAGDMPKPVKKGDKFRSSGIGGEVNALFANLAFFK